MFNVQCLDPQTPKMLFQTMKDHLFFTFGSTIAINQIHMKQNKYVFKC